MVSQEAALITIARKAMKGERFGYIWEGWEDREGCPVSFADDFYIRQC